MATVTDSKCDCGCKEEVVWLRDELAALKQQVSELVEIAKGCQHIAVKGSVATTGADGTSPGMQEDVAKWTVAKGRGNKLILRKDKPRVPTQNRFSCLNTQTEKPEQLAREAQVSTQART